MWNAAYHYLQVDAVLLAHRERRSERTREKQMMRATQDPFEMDNDAFIDLFRLKPNTVMSLVEELRPDLERERPYGLSVESQVLTALRFFAKGCHQDAVGEHWDLGLSQSSVSRSIRDVSNALNRRLLRTQVKFPMTPDERHAAKIKFSNARQPFPGTIGAIDCSYVNIIGPPGNEEAFVNHHGNHALNVQVICDADLKILNINARYPGARNDYFIWKNSAVYHALNTSYGEGERNTWLIGDDGYFIEPWLMTPLKHEAVGTPNFRYNEALCKARSVVERLFGVLKSEFRCIASSNTLLYSPEMASKIVNSCAILHNMRIADRLQEIPIDPVEVAAQAEAQAIVRNVAPDRDEHGAPLTHRAVGKRTQARLIAQHFT